MINVSDDGDITEFFYHWIPTAKGVKSGCKFKGANYTCERPRGIGKLLKLHLHEALKTTNQAQPQAISAF
jgi:hypothetical protein